jgi:catechol 2,3-dioxygenase-like lactoylglutathione lyase family enzyme
MKIKSIAGTAFYVKDLPKTIEFYEKLGFDFKTKDERHAVGYINWAWIDFLEIAKEDKPNFIDETKKENKGAGVYFYLSVENVDEAYNQLIAEGFQPTTEPKNWPWGNREFVLKDPDGYKLVFFKRK